MTTWQQPLAGMPRVTSPYGPRTAPRTSGGTGSSNHLGVDYAAPTGTPVRAIGAGTVRTSAMLPGSGGTVIIDHPTGVQSRYFHLSARLVKTGQRIDAGDLIGKAGSTGNTSGAHLHLEVLVNGTRTDPARFLAGRVGTSPSAKPRPLVVLREGSRGPEVEKLQRALNKLLPRTRTRQPLVADGVYGWRTTARVVEAQALLRLRMDGVAGKDTQTALRM